MNEHRVGTALAAGVLMEKFEQDWLAPMLRSSMFWKPARQAQSAWLEHVPFAFWLIDVLRPRLAVELGTQRGVSYSAICQAVKTLDLPTACFAVDTWKGDPHAGFYSEEVYSEFSAFHDRHYAAFSRRVRSTFDEALPHFEDGTIDLLHIDGHHAYEDVRHDYESWLPKLAPDAVVLFHDTNVRESDFGVFRLWAELTPGRPHFEFRHGHGLGVIGLGGNYPAPLGFLFDAADDDRVAGPLREIFTCAGQSARFVCERAVLERDSGSGVRIEDPAPAEPPQPDRDDARNQQQSIVAIVPLYNGARWIEEAVRSVLAQTRMPDEFVIVDDGSTDDGPAIVERLAAEYPVIKFMRKPHGGQSAARNFAVAHSKSAFIALLDQDDLWYPNHLEDLLKPFDKSPSLGWAYSDFDDINENGQMITRSVIRQSGLENPKRQLNSLLRQGAIIQPSATLISRTAFEAVGGFDETLCGYEDDDLFLRIFRANFDNVYIPESTSQWRIHASSCGASDRHDDSLKAYIDKLIVMYPDDKWRGVYYVRDLIAPRFIRIWMLMYARAARYRNHAKMREYATEASRLVRHLGLARRPLVGLALAVLRLPIAGRAILAIRPTWAYRRLLPQ